MRRLNLFFTLFTVCFISVSCDSDEQNINESNKTNDTENEIAKIVSGGTRKAVLLTSTDTSTGQTTTIYDCTQAGNNCDVATPLNKNVQEIDKINDLPIFQNEIIKQNIIANNLSVNFKENYAELIDNKNSKVLFVYSFTNDVNNSNSTTQLTEPVFKKALIDTETNTIICNTDGKNCRVSALTESSKSINQLELNNILPFFNSLYPKEDIFSESNSNYSVKKYNNSIRLDFDRKGEKISLFYVQK